MFFLLSFLESVFPFLMGALRKSWNSLSNTQQDALVNSGMIGQFLKNNLTMLGTDLVNVIAKNTTLSPDQVTNTLIALAAAFGFTGNDLNQAVSYLQSKLQNASSDKEWNGLLNILLNTGATILSGGALDWVHVALGLGEWVYQQFVQPKTHLTLNIASVDVSNPGAPKQVAAPGAQSGTSNNVQIGQDNIKTTGLANSSQQQQESKPAEQQQG